MNRSIPRRIDEMARTNGKGQTTKNKRLHRTTVSGNRLVLNGSSIYDCSLPCFIFFKFVSLMAKDNQTTITKNVYFLSFFFGIRFGSLRCGCTKQQQKIMAKVNDTNDRLRSIRK